MPETPEYVHEASQSLQSARDEPDGVVSVVVSEIELPRRYNINKMVRIVSEDSDKVGFC